MDNELERAVQRSYEARSRKWNTIADLATLAMLFLVLLILVGFVVRMDERSERLYSLVATTEANISAGTRRP
jgi:hypothetical protein